MMMCVRTITELHFLKCGLASPIDRCICQKIFGNRFLSIAPSFQSCDDDNRARIDGCIADSQSKFGIWNLRVKAMRNLEFKTAVAACSLWIALTSTWWDFIITKHTMSTQ